MVYHKIICGDCLEKLKDIEEESIDMVIVDPPYRTTQYITKERWGKEIKDLSLRKRIAPFDAEWDRFTPEDYAKFTNKWVLEIYRILRQKGTAFIHCILTGEWLGLSEIVSSCKKSGFKLLNNISWCLSEDTKMFILRDGKYLHISIKDVKLNDSVIVFDKNDNFRWVKIKNKYNIGIKSALKITTKSGKEVICSDDHKFPVKSDYYYGKFLKLNIKKAKDLTTKDCLWVNYKLHNILPYGNSDDYRKGFIIGFFLAEGSYIKRTIGIYKDTIYSKAAQKRYGKLEKPTTILDGVQFGCGVKDLLKGYLKYLDIFDIKMKNYKGNGLSVWSRDKSLLCLIISFVDGDHCDGKHFNQKVWNESKLFIKGIIDGFLAGDGHDDKKNNRWRVGIKPNRELRDDLILACRLIGYEFRYEGIYDTNYGTKKMSFTIRKRITRKAFLNSLYVDRIDKIEKIGNRQFYDIEIAPIYSVNSKTVRLNKEKEKWNHLYFLANGIWTKNCKPNGQPNLRGVRFSFSTEQILWVSKEGKGKRTFNYQILKSLNGGKQMRDYWIIPTESTSSNHPSVKPLALAKRMVIGCSNEDDLILDPFVGSGTTQVACEQLGRNSIGIEISKEYCDIAYKRLKREVDQIKLGRNKSKIEKIGF
jgi:DNA modification methylase